MVNVTPGQVRNQDLIRNRRKCKFEILVTQEIKLWVLTQVQTDFNSCVFSSKLFHSLYQKTFPLNGLSRQQFRLLLKSLNLRYRIPSIKPTLNFHKTGKDIEVLQFIGNLCGYIQKNYNLIFIDECSLANISKYCHKQWMIIGAVKQSIHRMSSFKCVLAAIGQQDFFYYQMIIGTGKAFIFQEFIANLYEKSQLHYQSQKFLFVLDNCTIHKSKLMMSLFVNIPHVFTPPYRPEFNGTEHLFGWMKRQIVVSQPVLDYPAKLIAIQLKNGVRVSLSQCQRSQPSNEIILKQIILILI